MRKAGPKHWALAVLAILPWCGLGCSEPLQTTTQPTDESLQMILPPTGELLVVNFQKDQPLRYRMMSERKTLIDLMGSAAAQRQQSQTMTEKLELVMVYTPVEVNPFGLTTLKVTCESASVSRTSFSGRREAADAVESLPQMSYTLKLTPTGKIEDLSDFHRVIRQLGDKAFANVSPTAGRVKNPDMISDLMVLQWYLWDSVASIKDPARGVSVGTTWTAKQMLPWPAPIPAPPTCITTYTLDRMLDESQSQKAIITSTATLAEEPVSDVPRPYEGSFQMRGLFGFLRQYRFTSITGTGEQVFDITTGTLEKDRQQYMLDVTADFALPLGDSKPVLKVDQTLSIELLP